MFGDLSPVVSKTSFRHFVTFVNDFSQMTWIYFMKNRFELFSQFIAFCVKIKNQLMCLGDNAMEYFSNSFKSYMI